MLGGGLDILLHHNGALGREVKVEEQCVVAVTAPPKLSEDDVFVQVFVENLQFSESGNSVRDATL